MKAWSDFVASQEPKFGVETIEKWLRTLKVTGFDSANLYLEAQDPFQIGWFEEHMRPLIKANLLNNNFRPIKVHLKLKTDATKNQPRSASSILTFTPDLIDSSMRLEDFVPGKANAMILEFFKELVQKKQPLASFNPIYLWGAQQSGKTHLLMGLTQAFQALGHKVLYVRLETFTEHVVAAIRSSQMQAFRKHYRNVDLLVVDDVHHLARKNATQEEFFHTFNALHALNRQIILSSYMAPFNLEEIEARLVSRFEWGMTLHLQPLSPEELSQVLSRRCHVLQFPLSEEVVEFLIETFSGSKGLSIALETLILRSHLRSLDSLALNVEGIKTLLKDLIDKEKKKILSPEKIVGAVAEKYNLKAGDLLGKSQTQECSLPRQIAMYLCRKELKLPFQSIGKFFSNRDHSTVMTSIKVIETKLEVDRELLASIMDLRESLYRDDLQNRFSAGAKAPRIDDQEGG